MVASDTDSFYFRQLLSGRDFASADPMAHQMVNFAYLVGDRSTGECLVVDPAYAVGDLIAAAEADGMRIVGVLASHYHPDHVGGSMMGHTIEGISTLLEHHPVPIHANEHEVPWIVRTTGVSTNDVVPHAGGDTVTVGSVTITCVHTPGHTPGSQCFLVDGALISGDTLFLEGCGRTDLPGSDVGDMYASLQKLASLPDDTIVFPGHQYSVPPAAYMGEVKQHNYVFKPRTQEQWLMMFGRD